ncbi:hypothetical protein [Pseudoalteromonas sp. B530]|uniref:hypothetical protein n=1 Tax=Pseudoalteromonas sp. B530 TaxID=2994390 RepID=UPI00224ADB2A|nr:hypothetical protein [Pseudoalteromonas sp. B530]MCX2769766.1 hypothetical protein [Pseudoalteromonas sp. B530]
MTKRYVKELAKNAAPLFLVLYCLIGVFPILQYSYLNHEPFIFAFKYVGPLFLLAFLYFYWSNIRYQKLLIKIALMFQVIMKVFFITIMTTGYILLLNDLSSKPETTCFSGNVTDKWANSESLFFTDYNFKLKDRNTGTVESLNVTKKDFDQHKVGELYSGCFKEGILGIRFK